MNLNLDPKELMDQLRNQLRPEMSKISFDTYVNQTIIEKIDNSNIVFQVDTDYKKDMLEHRYASLILNALQDITNRNFTFSVHSLEKYVKTDENKNVIISSQKHSEEEIDYSNQSLNPKYTF